MIDLTHERNIFARHFPQLNTSDECFEVWIQAIKSTQEGLVNIYFCREDSFRVESDDGILINGLNTKEEALEWCQANGYRIEPEF